MIIKNIKENKNMIVHVTKENFKEVVETEKTVLLDFWAGWCGPCRMLGPVLEKLDQEVDIVIGKVDVDAEEELAASFNISSIPALFVIKNGKVVNKSLGYQGLDSLKNLVK